MEVELSDREIEVEVANTALKRGLGLSLRSKGKMLFVFPSDTRAPIDMMLMRKSLHLYFMDSSGEVIHVKKAEPWYRLPEKFFHRPEEKYRYLLESFEDLEIREGDRPDFKLI